MRQSHPSNPPASARPRKPRRAFGLAAGALLALAVLLASCSGPGEDGQAKSAGGGKRSSDAGSVTLDITWEGQDSGLVFTVQMDTHAVDLDGFDLKELAVLRTDEGVEVSPASWESPAGGHHREGTLTFPAVVDGRPVLGEATRGVTVVVRDVAAPERSFRWTW
ncbi:MAG: hypothetical protein HY875_02410 [Chloroflexi bacterium]|nr:hypothetical protein [Chloroflexota bacterium]